MRWTVREPHECVMLRPHETNRAALPGERNRGHPGARQERRAMGVRTVPRAVRAHPSSSCMDDAAELVDGDGRPPPLKPLVEPVARAAKCVHGKRVTPPWDGPAWTERCQWNAHQKKDALGPGRGDTSSPAAHEPDRARASLSQAHAFIARRALATAREPRQPHPTADFSRRSDL